MRGYCSRCGNQIALSPTDEYGPANDHGRWLAYRCDCGHAAVVRDGDLADVNPDAWAKAASAKRKDNKDAGVDDLRAHWLN